MKPPLRFNFVDDLSSDVRLMFLLQVNVAGLPIAQGSKRWVGRMVEANEAKLNPWRQLVAGEARERMHGQDPVRCPLRLEVEFNFPRPRSHYGTGGNRDTIRPAYLHAKRTGRPDLDKLVRSVFDAVTGVVLCDDAQVVELVARKRFGPAGCKMLFSEVSH